MKKSVLDYTQYGNPNMLGEIYNDDTFLAGGMNAPEYTQRHVIPRSAERSIRKELEDCGFPPDIVNKADGLHQVANIGTRRGRRRLQTIFYYALAAYNQLGIPVDPQEVARKCGLNPSEVSKSMSRCSVKADDSVPKIVFYSPLDFIEQSYDRFMKNTELTLEFSPDTLGELKTMTSEILTTKPDLTDEKPQIVAAAILLLYLTNKGIKYDKKLYAGMFGSSDMTISKIYKLADAAYNAGSK